MHSDRCRGSHAGVETDEVQTAQQTNNRAPRPTGQQSDQNVGRQANVQTGRQPQRW
jgi:hypothetical protein